MHIYTKEEKFNMVFQPKTKLCDVKDRVVYRLNNIIESKSKNNVDNSTTELIEITEFSNNNNNISNKIQDIHSIQKEGNNSFQNNDKADTNMRPSEDKPNMY